MTTLYLDTFAGISGDMCLGLLVDLGLDPAGLEAALRALPVAGWQLEVRAERRHGLGGTRVAVHCEQPQPHRTWRDIDALLAAAPLAPVVSDRARRIFRRLGEAEAHVHRVPLEEVHFHEVGAVDAIVDIVGTCFGLHALGIDAVACAPLPLSQGVIRGSHGALPLPAPAVLELLRGAPVRAAGSDFELVTPTGAAIAAEIATFGPLPAMTVTRTGYGVGGRDLADRPNLLRGILGRDGAADGLQHDTVTVIETHIDDSLPEILGTLLERLLAAGALDAAFTPRQMKKNRPGTTLTVLAPPALADTLARLVLRESSAIGVRLYDTRRLKLRREIRTVDTPLGPAEVKLVFEGATLLRASPEHAACVALAASSGKPLGEVYRLVTAAAARACGLDP
ncbi:MAG: nickel pincer cofactor biosynthesis protein LarC [Deltaproteobacteria bacterium]|nr:MAG: nickel pincer cofactor biosynthesis protein LarC [Deltaproteobacteria bacterium]